MAKPPRWARRFLSETDLGAITEAIKAAESRTSAEIRVHLERRLGRGFFGRKRVDALARARAVFAKLGMHRTAERHGVLIYLAVDERTLAVVGDVRSEEHTSELQSRLHLVCRLLLEKKKKKCNI